MERRELFMNKKLDKFKKVKGIKEVMKYGLPLPETIFIFNFKKQKKEIEDFLREKKYVAIRSDKKNDLDFCPHNLRCPRDKAKKLIKDLISKGFAIILHEQNHIPLGEDQNKVSGNILILKKYMLIELMRGEPLILLNRDGKVDEHIKVKKDNLKEIRHFGERLIKKEILNKILKMVTPIPPYKLVEFTIGPDWLFFWQIRDDETAKKLKD